MSYLLYSLLVGLVIYSLLNFTEGDTGLEAMNRVESYRNLLNSNLDEINKINSELTVEFDALSSDSEMIKLKARALGYYDQGDHLVHIENWNPNYNEYNPGVVVKREYRIDVDEQPFRLMAISGTLFVLVLTILFSMVSRRKG